MPATFPPPTKAQVVIAAASTQKKAVLVDSITGEFAIVHAKGEGYAPECKMMPPTPVMRDFSANVGVKVGHTMSKTVADSPTEVSFFSRWLREALVSSFVDSVIRVRI